MSVDNRGLTYGLGIILLAGILNGSWNAAFSPKLGIAVQLSNKEAEKGGFHRAIKVQRVFRKQLSSCCNSRTSSGNSHHIPTNDLEFHTASLLFRTYATLFNVLLCIIWAGGPTQVSYIISQASFKTLGLVTIFSMLWGVGSIVLGIACRIAGVGLGTNIFFGTMTILGTLLPLVMNGLVFTTFGAIILVGIFICGVGLYFSTVSLKLRDINERVLEIQSRERQIIEKNGDIRSGEIGKIDDHEQGKGSQEENNAHQSENHKQEDMTEEEEEQTNQQNDEPRMFLKVGICILGGVFSSMLQFTFIFGDELRQAALESPNTPNSGSAAVLWLLAFSLQYPVSFAYSLTQSTQPLKVIFLCPWWRHVLVFMTTSIPWVAHVHLYGLATKLLPDDVATSVAWPVLMMTTVTQGIMLSLMLGEWKFSGKKAWWNLKMGLGIKFVGIVVLMLSAAV